MAIDTGVLPRLVGEVDDEIAERRGATRRRAVAELRLARPRRPACAQSDRAELTSCQAGGEQRRRVRGDRVGIDRLQRVHHPLPIPRAGTLITRRRLTSSCGLMISLR